MIEKTPLVKIKNVFRSFLSFAGVIIFGIFAYIVIQVPILSVEENQEEIKQVFAETQEGYESLEPLVIEVDLISINPSEGKLKVKISYIIPENLLDENDFLDTYLELEVCPVFDGKEELFFVPGDSMSPHTMTIELYGDSRRYPFDEYETFLELYLYEVEYEISNEGEKETIYDEYPIKVVIFYDIPGYSTSIVEYKDWEPDNASTSNYANGVADLVISVSHSDAVFNFILFTYFMQWILAFVAFMTTWIMLVQKRKVTIANFSWLGALIFALISLRNATPHAPPVGTLGDEMAYFWTLGIITMSMLIMVLIWVFRKEKE